MQITYCFVEVSFFMPKKMGAPARPNIANKKCHSFADNSPGGSVVRRDKKASGKSLDSTGWGAGLILAQRLRRWAKSKPASCSGVQTQNCG